MRDCLDDDKVLFIKYECLCWGKEGRSKTFCLLKRSFFYFLFRG